MQEMTVSTWAEFESLVESKKLVMQYSEGSNEYEIYAPEAGVFLWHVTLIKGTEDGDDFEDNHKATANAPLEIKAGVGRTERKCVSPQPNSTTEFWKGYEVVCGASDSSKDIDITFASKVYVRGGRVVSKDVVNGDKFKVEIQMQISGTWTTILTPMSDIYLVANVPEEVKGDDCMEFPTTYRLKFTFTPASTGTEKKIYLTLDYYA